MAKYYGVYRCLLCNKLFRVTNNIVNIEENQLPEILGRIESNQQFAGNPYLYQAPMRVPHKCGNGDGGFAHFAGFKKVQDTEEPLYQKKPWLKKFLEK